MNRSKGQRIHADSITVSKDERRQSRVPYVGPIVVSWLEGGEPRYARGRTLDVSESGLRIELPVAIPVLAEITLRAERINVQGGARIRNVVRHGSKYQVGVTLSDALRSKLSVDAESQTNLV
jgi:hypothetical protein